MCIKIYNFLQFLKILRRDWCEEHFASPLYLVLRLIPWLAGLLGFNSRLSFQSFFAYRLQNPLYLSTINTIQPPTSVFFHVLMYPAQWWVVTKDDPSLDTKNWFNVSVHISAQWCYHCKFASSSDVFFPVTLKLD